jgi:hypothetical protein
MSTPPPTDPKGAVKTDLTSAIVWVLLSAAFAVFMFVQSDKVDAEKKSFYLVAGGIGVVGMAINAYSAWNLYKKSKAK